MSKKGLELLAPAGTLQVFKSVIDAGADAVYFGGPEFGARAYAGNLTLEESREAISYAHLFGRKAYLTVNTLLKNREMDELYEYIRSYYDMGLDGILVQDMGVLAMTRKYFPGLPVHISTQMSVVSKYGAEELKTLGAERIVLSRELSLSEIRNIYQTTGMELEAFVHGALCVCYSGQCLMSSFLGGRSGNRGRCAQPCRLPYKVQEYNGTLVKQPGPYMLSPKDFCLIDSIPDMDEAGVYSFKIEGRMKSLEYAATVVSVYREAMDRYIAEGREGYYVTKRERELLLDAGSRNGFTDLYLHHRNGKDLMSFSDSSHENRLKSGETEIPVPLKIPVQMEIRIAPEKETSLRITSGNTSVIVKGDTADHAKKAPLTTDAVRKQLLKLGDTPFICREPLITLDENAFLPVHSINELRREALEELKQKLSMDPKREPALPPVEKENSPEAMLRDRKEPALFLGVRTEEQLRSALEYLDQDCNLILPIEVLLRPGEWEPYFGNFKENIGGIVHYREYTIRLILDLPEILRQREADLLNSSGFADWSNSYYGFRCHSMDGLGYLRSHGISKERIFLSNRLYAWSDATVHSYEKLGYHFLEIPAELTEKELRHRDNRRSVLSLYGRQVLMIKADCTHKNIRGCDRHPEILGLKDRKNVSFPVLNRCSICMNYIYNSIPSSILRDRESAYSLNPYGFGIYFTLERSDEVSSVMEAYRRFRSGRAAALPFETTRGHYKKGVL